MHTARKENKNIVDGYFLDRLSSLWIILDENNIILFPYAYPIPINTFSPNDIQLNASVTCNNNKSSSVGALLIVHPDADWINWLPRKLNRIVMARKLGSRNEKRKFVLPISTCVEEDPQRPGDFS